MASNETTPAVFGQPEIIKPLSHRVEYGDMLSRDRGRCSLDTPNP